MVIELNYPAAILAGILTCTLICPNMSTQTTGMLFKKSFIIGNPDKSNWQSHVKFKVSSLILQILQRLHNLHSGK